MTLKLIMDDSIPFAQAILGEKQSEIIYIQLLAKNQGVKCIHLKIKIWSYYFAMQR